MTDTHWCRDCGMVQSQCTCTTPDLTPATVRVIATVEVCDDCMFVNVNGEVSPDRPADAPPVWGKLSGADAVHDCADCTSGDSHAFRFVDCDACGDAVNTVHTMAIFKW
jgi:hypothetical protein